MKSLLIAITSFILGCVATGLLFRAGMEALDEKELVSYQHAELLKGTLVASGQGEKVIGLIRNYIENGICKDASIQFMYSRRKHRQRISEEIQRFYFALDEEPPEHVSKWLEDGTLTYEKVEDAFLKSASRIGRNEKRISITPKFRNISNVSWEGLAATAYLFDAEGALIEEKEERWSRVANPQDEVVFEFVFENPAPGQESFLRGCHIDVKLRGTKADRDAGGNR